MDAHTLGAPRPPTTPRRRLVQLEAGEKIRALVISETFWGVAQHWRKNAGPRGRSERCWSEERDFCQGCADQLPTRWKAYIELLDLSHRKPVFLELTESAYDSLVESLRSRQSMRGLVLEASRVGKGKKGRMLAAFHESFTDISGLPKPGDPNELLDTLFDWNR